MKKRAYVLASQIATGGLALGWLQAFELVDFQNMFVSFLSQIINLVVSIFFGIDPSMLLQPTA